MDLKLSLRLWWSLCWRYFVCLFTVGIGLALLTAAMLMALGYNQVETDAILQGQGVGAKIRGFSKLFGSFLAIWWLLRKRRGRLTLSVQTQQGEGISPNIGHALRLWWCFFIKFLLPCLVLMLAIMVAGFFGGLSGKGSAWAVSLPAALFYLGFMVYFSMRAISLSVNRSYNGFNLVLVDRDETLNP